MKYKIGDKVRVIKDNKWRNAGEIGVIDKIDSIGATYRVKFETEDYEGDYGCFIEESSLAPLTFSWDNLYPGVILVRNGEESMVLEVGQSGKTFLRSSTGDFDKAGLWLTITEAQKFGWKIKGQEEKKEKEEKVELTLEEVAKKFEIPVEKLRIKDHG